MAKATRRARTDDETTRANNTRSDSLQTAVPNSDIARRAYELYEQRGGVHGRDLDDWLLAENELRGAVRSTAA
jgi:hypothetical protein